MGGAHHRERYAASARVLTEYSKVRVGGIDNDGNGAVPNMLKSAGFRGCGCRKSQKMAEGKRLNLAQKHQSGITNTKPVRNRPDFAKAYVIDGEILV